MKMVRFIFVCMAVVALSVVAIAAQYMTGGISDATQSVIARNMDDTQDVQAIASAEDMTAEQLNAIETTAGTPSFDPNDTFDGGFTNVAPKALADTPAPAAIETTPALDEQAN